jgi:hypothetical protein
LKYGLIKPAVSSGHTAFGKGCLVFPLKNNDGQIVGMYFRETDDNKVKPPLLPYKTAMDYTHIIPSQKLRN